MSNRVLLYSPKATTLSGIFTLVRFLQSAKARLPMYIAPLPTVTVLSPLQPSNMRGPMFFTLSQTRNAVATSATLPRGKYLSFRPFKRNEAVLPRFFHSPSCTLPL